ncbi:MAG: DUF2817 domain-containing protein [Gemmatimonadota bacterium]|jgi:hypothetical protein|nr:DUF2817 domain-containing protein [Gemmatimonadota bacterium]
MRLPICPMRTPVFVALLAALLSPALLRAQLTPRSWQEITHFQAGPTPYAPLMEFWYELAARSPEVRIQSLTPTPGDHEVTLVTISSEEIFSPEDAVRSGKTVVLVTNAVHGGEPAGKEASQLVARDLVSGPLRPLLDDVIVLFVPLLNPDGGEVGRRESEDGLDLNRDYIKLESPEIRALVTRVINLWNPDIHVDTHHGGSPPYTLTWQGTLNPAADAELRAYPYEVIFPRIRAALRARDFDGFDYQGELTVGGERGWGSTSVEPRKQHVYAGMINTIGILLETPDNSMRLLGNGTRLETVPLSDRYAYQVEGQRIALTEILKVAAEDREEIRAITSGSRDRAVRAGESFEDSDRLILDYRLVSRGREDVWMPDSTVPGGYQRQEVEVFLEYEPTRTISRPLGYILLPSMERALPFLLDHDIVVYRLAEPAVLELEVYSAAGVRELGYFEKHNLRTVDVELSSRSIELPAGAFYIPMAQPRGNLIGYLLEPETDDNLVTWGYVDQALNRALRDEFGERLLPMMRIVKEPLLPALEPVQLEGYDWSR